MENLEPTTTHLKPSDLDVASIALRKLHGGLHSLYQALYTEHREAPLSGAYEEYMGQVELLLDQVDLLQTIIQE